jgi:hypothetical protein
MIFSSSSLAYKILPSVSSANPPGFGYELQHSLTFVFLLVKMFQTTYLKASKNMVVTLSIVKPSEGAEQ